jgi:osmotically inducible protein OsmC
LPVRNARAEWRGDVRHGHGNVSLGSGAFSGIGAAHAACFSMALSLILGTAGYTPDRIHTIAKVRIEKEGESFSITSIDLATTAEIPRIDEATFQRLADAAKTGCPVSKALASTPITRDARLSTTAKA